QEAARLKSVQAAVVLAGNDGEIDTAFAHLRERQIGALLVQPDPFLDGRLGRIAALARRYSVPTIAAYPEFAVSGGLISYGNSPTAAYRLMAAYIARILHVGLPRRSKVRPAQLIEPPHARGRTSVQHQDLGTDVSKDALSGPLVGDVGRDDSDAELLLHRCERGRVAGHDGHLGALVHQGLDKPETQAT